MIQENISYKEQREHDALSRVSCINLCGFLAICNHWTSKLYVTHIV